jgi:type VI secretion system protein ImpH
VAAQNRTQKSGMTWYAQLEAQPYAYDFYQVLRRLEAMHRGLPRIGDAVRPADEPVRLCQEPSLSFAPSNLSGFEQRVHGPPRLTSRFLGLFGPQGALPTHLTELARGRMRSYGDSTLVRFADLFHHRLLSAFYKAWRQAQPTACQDRPETDRFAAYLDALFGGGEQRDWLQAHAKRFFAGHLSRRTRNAGGLEAILCCYFGVPVALEPFHARWMPLPQDQRSVVGKGKSNCIGRTLVVGKRVWDAQHHFLLHIGPLTLIQYKSLLPGTPATASLRDWVRLYTDRQYGWRAQLLLRREEVPRLQLGRCNQLGWTAWLGSARGQDAVAGHLLHPEREAAPRTASPLSHTKLSAPASPHRRSHV